MVRTELAWLAGLLEGEGCFTINRPSPAQLAKSARRRAGVRIQLRMVDEDVVRRAAELMGTQRIQTYNTPTMRRHGDQVQYHAQVGGARAVELMEAIYPLMGERRQAKIAEILATPNLSHTPREAVSDGV